MSEIHPCVAGPFGALGFRRVGTCHRDSIDHLFRTILDPLGTLLNRSSSKKFDTVNILKIENHMISLSIFFQSFINFSIGAQSDRPEKKNAYRGLKQRSLLRWNCYIAFVLPSDLGGTDGSFTVTLIIRGMCYITGSVYTYFIVTGRYVHCGHVLVVPSHTISYLSEP